MDTETLAQQAIKALNGAEDHLTAAFDKLAKVQPPMQLVREAQAEIDIAADGIEQAMTLCRNWIADLKR